MEESFFFYLNVEFVDSIFLKKRTNLGKNDNGKSYAQDKNHINGL